MKYKAILVDKNPEGLYSVEHKSIEVNRFPENDTFIKIDYSSLNYKDCLALTSPAKVLKNVPMIPGIDLAGTVIHSKNGQYKEGDRVFVNGWGIGEKHWGGFSEYASINSEYLSLVPDTFTTFDVMAIGTAGYTSMLCIMALRKNDVLPGSGKILVTGASGGVSSIAILLLSSMGYEIVASTGRSKFEKHLIELGAKEVIPREELDKKSKPLEKQIWKGVIDVVGGETLASCLATTQYGGVVASTGLAGSIFLPTTVAPFIFRSVTLSGVDSVYCPKDNRQIAWKELEKYLSLKELKKITKSIKIDNIKKAATDMLAGNSLGRIVIDVNSK